MKFVVAPDSYKESLSAVEVGDTMARAIRDVIPSAEVIVIPMADGGEGTIDALIKASRGQHINVNITGPIGDQVTSHYGVIGDGSEAIAVIEAANTCGLMMIPMASRNPLGTTSRGMADAIYAALDQGYRRFVIGLGGSATNDGGMGLLAGLGARFNDSNGNRLLGYGRDLAQVNEVDLSDLDPRIQECSLTVACDVTNPLLGVQGASFVYGPQKGANVGELAEIDEAMARYASLIEEKFSLSLRETSGAGAAGGLGFALMALGANIVPGAQVVEEMTFLRKYIQDADWVLTGEGRSDEQTLFGKLPYHVARIAREAGKETILISGSLGDGAEELDRYFTGCFATTRQPMTLETCMAKAEVNLYQSTRQVIRMLCKIR